MAVYRSIDGDTPQIFPIIYARWAFDYTGGRQKEALALGQEFLAVAESQETTIPILLD